MIPEIDKVLKFPPLECRNADARCKQCISQHRCRVKGQSYTNVWQYVDHLYLYVLFYNTRI